MRGLLLGADADPAVLGVMNVAAMVAVAIVIALEKLLRGEWLAKAAGLVAIMAGIIIVVVSVRAL